MAEPDLKPTSPTPAGKAGPSRPALKTTGVRKLDAATAVLWFANAIKRNDRRPDAAAVEQFVELVNTILGLAALNLTAGLPSREAMFRVLAAIQKMKKPAGQIQAAFREIAEAWPALFATDAAGLTSAEIEFVAQDSKMQTLIAFSHQLDAFIGVIGKKPGRGRPPGHNSEIYDTWLANRARDVLLAAGWKKVALTTDRGPVAAVVAQAVQFINGQPQSATTLARRHRRKKLGRQILE